MTEATQRSFGLASPEEAGAWPDAREVGRDRRRRASVPPELAEFERRLKQHGLSEKTAACQMRSVRSAWKAAARIRGEEIDVLDLVEQYDLLAEAACSDERLDGRGRVPLARTTLMSRRQAIRSFFRQMEDATKCAADDAIEAFEDALRDGQYELRGQTYVPTSGRSGREPRFTPDRTDIEALAAELRKGRSCYLGERDTALLQLLFATGLRIGSILGIDGSDFRRTAAGLSVSVEEKGKDELVAVHLTPEVVRALEAYVRAHNGWTARVGVATRIGVGVPGAFWRCPRDRAWTVQGAQKILRYYSRRVCRGEYGPHAVRRAVARELLTSLSRGRVAEALGWQGPYVQDDHYAEEPAACPCAGSGIETKREGQGYDRRTTKAGQGTGRPAEVGA